jgi:hypothetical protein
VTTVLVCGSRNWTDIGAIRRRFVALPPNSVILYGAAPGADSIARGLADDFGFSVRAFPADWSKHGKSAGFIRNVQMLDEAPDLVIAFQRNGSRGTQHTIDQARRRGIPVEVINAR